MLVSRADCYDCFAEKGEAPERPQLLKMEHSHGPALIYNVNMLVERRLQWERWIDWALDKSFNGCTVTFQEGGFNPHQTHADDTCLQPEMLPCLSITRQFVICFLPVLVTKMRPRGKVLSELSTLSSHSSEKKASEEERCSFSSHSI